MDDQTSFVQHSLSERRLAFEHWVAFNSKIISEAISSRGDFVCPLLPCLEHFENLEICLQHLLRCPHLSGASYWCPFCGDKESFAAPQLRQDDDLSSFWDNISPVVPRSSRDDTERSPALQKSQSSKLKRAIAALIKLFGRNSFGAARNDSVPDPFHEPVPKLDSVPDLLHKPVSELDSKPVSELYSQPDSFHKPWFELSARLTICELDELRRFELSDKRHTRGPSGESTSSLEKSVVSPI